MIHLNPLVREENIPLGLKLLWMFYPECYSAVSVSDFLNERDGVKPTGTLLLPTAYHNGEILVRFECTLDLSCPAGRYFLSDSDNGFKLFDLTRNAPLSLGHRQLAEDAKVSPVTLDAPFVFYSQETKLSYLGGWKENGLRPPRGRREKLRFPTFSEEPLPVNP